MNYKAIGFDYGGVLKGQPDGEFLNNLLSLLDITYEQFSDSYYTHNLLVHRGELSWGELWEQLASDVGKPEKGSAAAQLFKDAEPTELNTQVIALVDQLRAAGYKTGLLSNNPHEMITTMRNERIDSHFDVFHVSAETGFVKPEPEAFTHFAKELGVELSELVFIDDSNKSLSTAEELGYTPIVFRSYQDLVNELRALALL